MKQKLFRYFILISALNILCLLFLKYFSHLFICSTGYIFQGLCENISESASNNKQIFKPLKTLLAWTFVYQSEIFEELKSNSVLHLDCGEFDCDVTRNRSYLLRSQVILLLNEKLKGILLDTYQIILIFFMS